MHVHSLNHLVQFEILCDCVQPLNPKISTMVPFDNTMQRLPQDVATISISHLPYLHCYIIHYNKSHCSTRIQRLTAHRALPVLATLLLQSCTKALCDVHSLIPQSPLKIHYIESMPKSNIEVEKLAALYPKFIS